MTSALGQRFLDANNGVPVFAAAALAAALMEDDPAKFKRGYTKESAVIAACGQIDGADEAAVTRAVEIALESQGATA